MVIETRDHNDGRRRHAGASCELLHQSFPRTEDCVTVPLTHTELDILAELRELKLHGRQLLHDVRVYERAIASGQAAAASELALARTELSRVRRRWRALAAERERAREERMRLLGHID